MDSKQNIEEKLWLYIDGQLPEQEKSLVDHLIDSDRAWKEKYQELLEVNELLRSSELDAPSMRFTRNVMEEISKMHIAPATRSYINKRIIWGLGIFFITMLIGVLAYGISQASLGSSEPGQISRNLGKLDFSKLFSNTWVNIFLGVNVFLGLVLLDHYLSNRKKEFTRFRRQ
jgi:anti-sigma factor RsiW